MMKCLRCGANIPDDQMRCPECGTEVQIVPDYNPLDDVLAREVKGSVEGATRQIRPSDVRKYNRKPGTGQSVNSTRVIRPGELERIREKRALPDSRPEQKKITRNTLDERRHRQQIRKREAARRRRRNFLITLFLLLVLVAAGIYVAYQNSYTGMMKKGYSQLEAGSYEQAEEYFNRAVRKDKSRAEAYVGLAEISIRQNDLSSAEEVFLSALGSQPGNAGLYEAIIEFYMDTEQPEKISPLLEDCSDTSVLKAVSDYISSAPVFRPEKGTYSEVQQIEITSDTGGTIYYTTDGTHPDISGKGGSTEKYKEPVLLQDEGTVEIRAVAVNDKGIPSVVSSSKYTIEFPIADAPAVNPATGQYTEPTQITIIVPDGYTAYYTMDGSTPTAESEKYTGPVDMPQDGQIITFNAVLINNSNGKATDVTTRSYITRAQ